MKKWIVATLGYVLVALSMALPAQAARVVDTDTVIQAMSRGAILWDIREAEAYCLARANKAWSAVWPTRSYKVSGGLFLVNQKGVM